MWAERRRTATFPDGERRVAIAWRSNLVGDVLEIAAAYDGALLVADPRREGGRSQWVFRMEDGRLLSVQIAITHFVLFAPDVRIDGRTLPGSAFDPVRWFRMSGRIVSNLAVVHVVLAAIYGHVNHSYPSVTAIVCAGATLWTAGFCFTFAPRLAAIATLLAAGFGIWTITVWSKGSWLIAPLDVAAALVATQALWRRSAT